MIDDLLPAAELEDESLPVDLYFVPGHPTDRGTAGNRTRQLDATISAYVAALEKQAAGSGRMVHRQARKKRKRKRGR